MTHGGKRPGAGRRSDFQKSALMSTAIAKVIRPDIDPGKVRTLADLEVALGESRDTMVKTILSRQTELTNAMIDLALGASLLEQEVDRETGEVQSKVYTQLPDRQALAWLLEQAHGKAKQVTETKQETTIYVVSNIPRPELAAGSVIDVDATFDGEEEPLTDD
jgi:hypothetical protein